MTQNVRGRTIPNGSPQAWSGASDSVRASQASDSSRIAQPVLAALIKYYAWRIITMLAFGVVYVQLISEGMRVLLPSLAIRLFKVPGLSFLKNYEDTFRLDLATVLAGFLLFAVCYLWERILDLYLNHGFDPFQYLPKVEKAIVDPDIKFVLIAGLIILTSDLFLFHIAVTAMTWGNPGVSLTSILATAIYVTSILVVTYLTIRLRGKAFRKD